MSKELNVIVWVLRDSAKTVCTAVGCIPVATFLAWLWKHWWWLMYLSEFCARLASVSVPLNKSGYAFEDRNPLWVLLLSSIMRFVWVLLPNCGWRRLVLSEFYNATPNVCFTGLWICSWRSPFSQQSRTDSDQKWNARNALYISWCQYDNTWESKTRRNVPGDRRCSRAKTIKMQQELKNTNLVCSKTN